MCLGSRVPLRPGRLGADGWSEQSDAVGQGFLLRVGYQCRADPRMLPLSPTGPDLTSSYFLHISFGIKRSSPAAPGTFGGVYSKVGEEVVWF